MVKRLKEQQIEHGDIEFIITAGEESGFGGESCDSIIRAKYGFAVDSDGKVGGIVTAAPFQAKNFCQNHRQNSACRRCS
ncbi:Peptidase T OS=Lysinibacillus sphaericus OX=1421 GN=pepT_1 PE=3 SV=1 [Lysinibacillus sphaericus]